MPPILQELFGTWIGLLSLGTVGFILLMAVYFIWLFMSKSAPPNS